MGADILYILGNGFDLHHSINSSYSDYRSWLSENDPSTLEEINEIYGKPSDSWWNSFEENLTSINKCFSLKLNSMSDGELIKAISQQYPEEMARIDNHNNYSKPVLVMSYAYAKAIQLVKRIKSSFSEWVKDIDINKQKSSLLSIDPNNNLLALSFNYTRTLEEVYKVDSVFVNHIHGRINNEDDDSDWNEPREFVLGHGMTADDIIDRDAANPYVATSCFSYDDNKGEDNMPLLQCYSALAEIKKPVDEIIANNQSFWDSIGKIQSIVIAGFSFSSIDEKYLVTVFDRIPQAAKTVVYYHTDNDLENASKFMIKVNREFEKKKW